MNKNIPTAYILKQNDPNQVQKDSAEAAKILSGIIKTCLGPRAMQKMVLTKINSIELTTDGNSILRELDVSHPSARCLIELSQTQDNECGDGTTSVIILAAELLNKMVSLKHHPIRLCKALTSARNICLKRLEEISTNNNPEDLIKIVEGSVSTKLCKMIGVPIPELALKTAKCIKSKESSVDIKNNVKIMKLLGDFKKSEVLDGVIIEKELIHSQMRRDIDNPRILLLDSPLEYKKGESQTNMEFTTPEDFSKVLKIEEDQIRILISKIMSLNPDIVVTEKGISDLALSILHENNITAIRRVKRSDNIRISKAVGATIINRIDDISEECIGKGCGKFENIKMGNEYFCKFYKCENPKAVTVILRGPTRDILAELERNFMDAVKVAKNMILSEKMVPGGGASEMAMSIALKKEKFNDKVETDVFEASSAAFKIIPSILISNSGAGMTLEILNDLEIKNESNSKFGINGITGSVESAVLMEPIIVKKQLVKSAFDSVIQLLRVDGIIESKL